MKWVEHVACAGKRNANKVVVGNPDVKGLVRRLTRRGEDNIKNILEKYSGRVQTEFMWFGTRASGRLLLIMRLGNFKSHKVSNC
jgi:hypothetical protein